ncbi:MAG TPA: hypothetical protein VG456_03605 [Candidatus Sulfopaludibacter sp.]|jgi:hypothetical protein|nr:hypothetical protein [Candidatus Sulfopaludibacter sp.]
MRARLIFALLAAAGVASGSREFDSVVKAIETHYGATRTHIPLMGVANLVLQVGHPAGTSGFHIALFEDLRTDLGDETEAAQLSAFMDKLASAHLRPFIHTLSRSTGDATYIFCGDTGKDSQILIATFSPHGANVIEVYVNFDTLIRWIQSPDTAGRSLQPDADRDR